MDCHGRRFSSVPPFFTQLVGGFLVATGFFAWLGALLLAGFTVAATAVKIGEGVRVRNVAPKLGEHNTEIFGCFGVTEARIKELRARGVL